jgi:DNA-binding ferritin-like protein (Dps family)
MRRFWDIITGSDMTQAFKVYEMRVKKLPPDYQVAWEKINTQLWPQADFTGRNLLPILEGVLGLLEESATDDQRVEAVLGDDINHFCSVLADVEGLKSFPENWHEQLNRNSAIKLGQSELKMSIQAIIAGKKKWFAHVARVKALPQDYQMGYQEIQKYIFMASPAEHTDWMELLSGLIDLFEEGAALSKSMLEITGTDVAAFCEDLIRGYKD